MIFLPMPTWHVNIADLTLPYLSAEGYCTGILYGICFICFQRRFDDDGGFQTPRISGGHSFAEADHREVAWMVKDDSKRL